MHGKIIIATAALSLLPVAATAQGSGLEKLDACTSQRGVTAQGTCLEGVVKDTESRMRAVVAQLHDRTSFDLRPPITLAQKAFEDYRDHTCGRMEWDIAKVGVGQVYGTASCVVRLTEQRIEIVTLLLSQPQ